MDNGTLVNDYGHYQGIKGLDTTCSNDLAANMCVSHVVGTHEKTHIQFFCGSESLCGASEFWSQLAPGGKWSQKLTSGPDS